MASFNRKPEDRASCAVGQIHVQRPYRPPLPTSVTDRYDGAGYPLASGKKISASKNLKSSKDFAAPLASHVKPYLQKPFIFGHFFNSAT
jgi:hypothetical protein